MQGRLVGGGAGAVPPPGASLAPVTFAAESVADWDGFLNQAIVQFWQAGQELGSEVCLHHPVSRQTAASTQTWA